ncbi:hypothetical protein NY547_13975 [Cnuibacter physcomitrellae]|uniref:hypothetical protein n=1 Tax=Cnuibacter physcomitrellae TaxID=1619308 RepID=UPI002175ECD4|nr:hypothetical protein [Cnuibacter physcomitrellae]MCS5498355.1 hypothetical protein [Cnuibacter physcomitrellae]
MAASELEDRGDTEVWTFLLHVRDRVAPALVDTIGLAAPTSRAELEAAGRWLYGPFGVDLTTRIARPRQGVFVATVHRRERRGPQEG